MFPLQPGHSVDFGTPITSLADQVHDYDQFTDTPFMDNNFLENNLISFSIGDNHGESRKVVEKRHGSKKLIHREVEMKRRQEMSNLYASLRSLLPADRIKGKRSVCDQMHEAVIHIKEMEKNIEELKSKRDNLKMSVCNSARSGVGDDISDCVTVNMAGDGIEILITRSIKASDLGLSRVFQELLARGFNIVSSVSTRMNEIFIHKIQIEAREMTNLYVSDLQEILIKALK